MQTTIAKWGNSQAIRLPKTILQTANIAESDTVELLPLKNSIIIKKAEKARRQHIPLAQRIKDWDGKPYELTQEDNEWLDMKPAGEEVW